MSTITLEKLTLQHSTRLAEIIGSDRVLHMQLSPSQPMRPEEPEAYYAYCSQWAAKRHAICYAILLDNIPIGSISLCDIDADHKSARVGYWIESCQWGKGYATQAFALVIGQAQMLGVEVLTCSILKDNAASIALWKRQGATLTERDDRVIPTLRIGNL